MGKRAQEKRAHKMNAQPKASMVSRILRWDQFRHPHFWLGLLAFILVIGYPFAINSSWYKKHVAHLSGEQLAVETGQRADITTEKGHIVIEFYPKDAPKTTENFIRLASRGYYNNLTFHRVEQDFVIQGGDPNGDGTGGVSATGGKFDDEINPDSPLYKTGYKEGIVAMANAGPNTNGSQFFIMLADHPDLPPNYTIFAHVTAGMDVVKKIAKGDKMTKIEVQ